MFSFTAQDKTKNFIVPEQMVINSCVHFLVICELMKDGKQLKMKTYVGTNLADWPISLVFCSVLSFILGALALVI
jgi:hypothetical protein